MARKLLIASIALVATLGFAATDGVASANVAAASPTTASVISTAKNAKLGTILVSGNTVYTLKASKTACSADCLKAWLPVLLPPSVTTAMADTGVDASKLGTVAAAGGALQVTYSGKALYWYAKDTAPGQVHGNVTNKWGKWSTVVTAKSSSGSGKTNDSSNAGTGGAGF
jgi:predicted lipoprotein with Yx(FWY)xxD motif